jgi:hypothetical protein
MTDYPKNMMEMMKAFTAAMPQVTPTANGYEIRTKILELAQTQAFQPVQTKLGLYNVGATWEADKLLTTITWPDADEVLKIAEQFNDFVSGKSTTAKKG